MTVFELKQSPLSVNKLGISEYHMDWLTKRLNIDPQSGCWIWTGAIRPDGYGQMKIGYASSSPFRVHRLTYLLVHGYIPKHHVHHTCNTKLCANPDHLQSVTPKEHVAITPGCAGYIARSKSHCAQGHPYDEVNTYIPKNGKNKGKRICRTCLAAYKKDWAIRNGRETGVGHVNRKLRPRPSTCKRGHPLTEDNVYILDKSTGTRTCKTCAKARGQKYYQMKKVTVTPDGGER